ncbi:MAG: right-handed parallel beta-helix repeat-containing protein [Bacteroidota bacterium]
MKMITSKTTVTLLIIFFKISVASIAQNYPDNPWGEEWEHVYDGLDQSTQLQVQDKQNVLIINSNIHDVHGAKNALEIENCKNVLIINNTISGHRFEGHGNALQIRYGSENVIIENNEIFDCDGTGISTAGSSTVCCPHDNPVLGCIIRGNIIHDIGKYPDPVGNSPKHGMYIKAQDVLIEDNIVYNSYDGQGLSVRSTGIVRGNKVWNCKNWPFAYWPQKEGGPSDKLIIENNVFYQDGNYDGPLSPSGILVISNSNGFKFNNFVVRFNTLVRFKDAAHTRQMLFMATETYSNVKVYGNILIDELPEGPKHFRGEEDCSYLDKNFTSTSLEGFKDADSRDFRLTPSHPAIGYATGVQEEFPSSDREGNPRTPASIDAGAYQLAEDNVVTSLDPELENDMLIYPNPVTTDQGVTIQLNESARYNELSVYSIDGRVLQTLSLTDESEFQLKGLMSGMYVITFKGPRQSTQSKLIVK